MICFTSDIDWAEEEVTPDDGKIDWSKSNIEIQRFINASGDPYQGAFTFYKNNKVIIHRSNLINRKTKWIGVPGQFAEFNETGTLNVLTGKGKIELIYIELNGKRDVPKSFFNSIRNRFNNYNYDI